MYLFKSVSMLTALSWILAMATLRNHQFLFLLLTQFSLQASSQAPPYWFQNEDIGVTSGYTRVSSFAKMLWIEYKINILFQIEYNSFRGLRLGLILSFLLYFYGTTAGHFQLFAGRYQSISFASLFWIPVWLQGLILNLSFSWAQEIFTNVINCGDSFWHLGVCSCLVSWAKKSEFKVFPFCKRFGSVSERFLSMTCTDAGSCSAARGFLQPDSSTDLQVPAGISINAALCQPGLFHQVAEEAKERNRCPGSTQLPFREGKLKHSLHQNIE